LLPEPAAPGQPTFIVENESDAAARSEIREEKYQLFFSGPASKTQEHTTAPSMSTANGRRPLRKPALEAAYDQFRNPQD
jgi:hypothetical protein